jgi:hypothetical protein
MFRGMDGYQMLQQVCLLIFTPRMQPLMLQALRMEIFIDVQFLTMNSTWKRTLHTLVRCIVFALVHVGLMYLCPALRIGP